MARPEAGRRLLEKSLCGLVAGILAVLALALPPLGSLPAAAATPALGISLTQSAAASAVGTQLTLTATVTWSGGETREPTDGWYVEFIGAGDGGWTSGPVPTDDGEASYARTSPVPQTETITARIANPGCTGTTSNPVIHEWWRGEISIEQVDVRTEVGQTFALEATLTHDGSPIRDATLELSAIERFTSNTFEPIRSTTNPSGTATFTWTSTRVTTELITVRELVPDGAASARTSHNWVAAITTDAMTLTVDQSRVRVGVSLIAAATLRNADGPVAGVMVEFFTNAPDSWDNPVLTDEDGRATFDYVAGPLGYIHVRTPSVGVVTTNFDVWQPAITFVSPDSRSVVSQAYPATVVVTDDGAPLRDVDLAFYVDGSDSSYARATTDDNGVASAPITLEDEDSPSLSVSEVLDSTVSVEATTDHTWVAAPNGLDVSVNLTQSSQESRVGTAVELSAEVLVGDGWVEGWDVGFTADDDSLGVGTTDENGISTITMSPDDVETFALITATVAIDGCTSPSDEVVHRWWQPSLDLNPENTTSPAGSDVRFTAALTRDTSSEDTVAVPDQLIRFTMISQSCPLPVVLREVRTNDDGIAGVAMSRDGPSIDGVRAEEIDVVGPASDATTHTWGAPVPPPLSITLAQDEVESRAGTEVIITATVGDTDRPGRRARAGTPVTFLGVSPARTVPTDASGVARLAVHGTSTNPTTVTASAPYGCGVVLSGSLTHRWFVPTLALTPNTATTTTGNTASVTAVLSDGQAPVGGQEIELTADHRTTGVATLTRTEITDKNGRAKFTWARSDAGIDDLTAIELVDVRPQQDTAEHVWESGPTRPSPIPEPDPDTPTPAVTTPTQTPTAPTPPDEPSETLESTPSPTPTETAAPSPSTIAPPSDLPATSTLVDGPEVGRPGADIEISGTGCRAGQRLTVRLGETSLGRTRAAADGTFYLRGVVPDLPLGRYLIRSTCGTTIGDPNVDITAPQVNKARAAIAAVGVTTASTFLFFLLLAKGVISFLPRRPY